MKIPAEQDVFSLLCLSVSPAGREEERKRKRKRRRKEKLMRESGYLKNPNLTGSTTLPRVDTVSLRGFPGLIQ